MRYVADGSQPRVGLCSPLGRPWPDRLLLGNLLHGSLGILHYNLPRADMLCPVCLGGIMRLNLGCGSKKISGWVNVDKVAACSPDQMVDLEKFPWPWPDNSVEAVSLSHVLEHLGGETKIYLGIIKELYRVCRDRAKIFIAVPHPRHDDFLTDPTHVRAITPEGLRMFSQSANREWIAGGFANTPLGLYIGVDFAIDFVNAIPDEPWKGRFERKEISLADLQNAARKYNNVMREFRVVMHPIKQTTAEVECDQLSSPHRRRPQAEDQH
jgi:hypothetical protein